MKLVIRYIRRHLGIFLLSLLFLTMEAVADLMQPTFMSYIVDDGVQNADEMFVRRLNKTSDHDDIVSMSRSRNPMNHVSVCIKRSALRKCGGYVRLLLLEDYYLWLRMIVGGAKLANLNQPLVYVRVGNGFEKKRGSRLRIEGWDFLQQYMVHNGLVSRFRALRNRAYIRGFVWTPTFVKKALYSTVLRKKHA